MFLDAEPGLLKAIFCPFETITQMLNMS